MSKQVFFSFNYMADHWRVSQIRNIGSIEDKPLLTSNEWENVKRGGDAAIREWINKQMQGKACVVVLIGADTAGRKWVDYEIKHAWENNKGLVGIYINSLKDSRGQQSAHGSSPFLGFTVGDRIPLTRYAKCYDSPYSDSNSTYNYIKTNIEQWVDEAIAARRSA